MRVDLSQSHNALTGENRRTDLARFFDQTYVRKQRAKTKFPRDKPVHNEILILERTIIRIYVRARKIQKKLQKQKRYEVELSLLTIICFSQKYKPISFFFSREIQHITSLIEETIENINVIKKVRYKENERGLSLFAQCLRIFFLAAFLYKQIYRCSTNKYFQRDQNITFRKQLKNLPKNLFT